ASALVDAEIIQLHGVRRAQRGGDVCLALETSNQLIACGPGRNVVANQFDGRRTDEESMPRKPDFAHPARTKRADQAIAPHGERFVELLSVELEHRALADENRP